MDNAEGTANVQNEKPKIEFSEHYSFSSSEGSSASKKRKWINDSESPLESLERENEKLKELDQILQTAVSKAVEISQLKGDDIRNVKPDFDNAKKCLQDQIEKLELSNNGLRTQLRQIDNESKRLRVEYNSLKSSKDKSSKKIEELEAKHLAMESAKINFRKKICEMEQQLQHQRKLFATKLDELVTDVKEKDKKIMELNAQLQEKLTIETSLQTKITEMEQKSDHQKKLHETKIAKLKAAVEEQVKKINDLDAQLLSKKISENNFVQDIVQIRQQLNQQRKFSDDKTCELDAIIKEQKKKMEELKIKLESKEKESKDFEADYELMQICYKDELKKDKELKDKHEKQMEELKDEMQAKINENNKINEDEIARFKSSHKDFMKVESEEHQTILMQYQNAIKILMFKVNISYSVEKDLKSKISELERKYEIAVAKIADREKKIQDFKNERERKEPECITLN